MKTDCRAVGSYLDRRMLKRVSRRAAVLLAGASLLVSPLFLGSQPFGNHLLVGSAEAAEQVAPEGPSVLVQATVNQLVEIVGRYPGDANTTKRRDELRKAIEPRFNFDEMSRQSLGANWTKLDENQQKVFVERFSELLALTYLRRIEHIQQDTVKVMSEKRKGNRALVKTEIQYKGDEFPLDYKLAFESGTWRVYDVIIENIGLVSNYRNEFAGIVRKHKAEGLLSMLKEKTERLRNEK